VKSDHYYSNQYKEANKYQVLTQNVNFVTECFSDCLGHICVEVSYIYMCQGIIYLYVSGYHVSMCDRVSYIYMCQGIIYLCVSGCYISMRGSGYHISICVRVSYLYMCQGVISLYVSGYHISICVRVSYLYVCQGIRASYAAVLKLEAIHIAGICLLQTTLVSTRSSFMSLKYTQ